MGVDPDPGQPLSIGPCHGPSERAYFSYRKQLRWRLIIEAPQCRHSGGEGEKRFNGPKSIHSEKFAVACGVALAISPIVCAWRRKRGGRYGALPAFSDWILRRIGRATPVLLRGEQGSMALARWPETVLGD
jgi:hypothetical protein